MCVYIDDAIKWLVEHEFYDIPFEDLKADFHVFWNYVKDNQDRRLIAIPLCIIKKQIRNIGPLFFVFLFFSNFFSIFFFFLFFLLLEYYDNEEDGSKSWNRSAIFVQVSTVKNIGSRFVNVLIVINYCLAFAWHSCEVERIGRVMNLTKTSSRVNMCNGTFFDLVFIKNVMPTNLDEVDFDAFIAYWKKKGHLLADTKLRQSKKKESQVFTRLEKETRASGLLPIGKRRIKKKESDDDDDANNDDDYGDDDYGGDDYGGDDYGGNDYGGNDYGGNDY